MHPQLAVDDGVCVAPHPRGADRVAETERSCSREIDEVLPALGLWAGNEFGFAYSIESLLAHKFPAGFYGSKGRLKIAVRAKQTPFDRRRNAPVGTRQAHLTAARRLNQ